MRSLNLQESEKGGVIRQAVKTTVMQDEESDVQEKHVILIRQSGAFSKYYCDASKKKLL